MNKLMIFSQKELLELFRTKKFIIMIGIFALFGMISPVLARYLQEIIKASVGDQFPITVAPATWTDSYSQLYNNLTQMGSLIVIFLFMSSISGEKLSGSAALTLTKNLPHSTFILSKFLTAGLVIFISTMSSILLCYVYTYYLFGYAGVLSDVILGALTYCAFALLLLSITILASTAARSTAVSALLSFAGFLFLLLSNSIPKIGSYLPGTLLTSSMELTANGTNSGILLQMGVSVCLLILFILVSIKIFKSQEL